MRASDDLTATVSNGKVETTRTEIHAAGHIEVNAPTTTLRAHGAGGRGTIKMSSAPETRRVTIELADDAPEVESAGFLQQLGERLGVQAARLRMVEVEDDEEE